MAPRRRPSHAGFKPAPMDSSTVSPSPPPRARRIHRASSIPNTTPGPKAPEPAEDSALSIYYYLKPTIPSPFTGSLDAALDAILDYGKRYGRIKGVQPIVSALLGEVNPKTSWPELLQGPADEPPGMLRFLWTSLLFLTSRTLLPELIAKNRALLWSAYVHKKSLAGRFMLRYDMLCAWKLEYSRMIGRSRDVAVTVASVEPEEEEDWDASPNVEGWYGEKAEVKADEAGIRLFMPNIIPTLIAAPQPWSTAAVRERMKHRVTDLDKFLLLTNEEVEAWGAERLLQMTCTLILHWQWLRRSNEKLEDMEVGGWADLDVKADE
ncbi:hypothetical protein Ptr902_00820 [Pyrenophora tritici-repentis]|nr:hypothetical protein Ptr902_00820 [Pyrenophora tritici-repentis]